MSQLIPYTCVRDCRAAVDWYVTTLGASVIGDPIVMDDGQIGHCELALNGAHRMMSDSFDDAGVAPPDPARHPAIKLHLTVADVDAVAARVSAAGTSMDRGPKDTPYDRVAVCRDPFDHRWMLNAI